MEWMRNRICDLLEKLSYFYELRMPLMGILGYDVRLESVNFWKDRDYLSFIKYSSNKSDYCSYGRYLNRVVFKARSDGKPYTSGKFSFMGVIILMPTLEDIRSFQERLQKYKNDDRLFTGAWMLLPKHDVPYS